MNRIYLTILLILASAMSACAKKEEPATPNAPAQQATPPVASTPTTETAPTAVAPAATSAPAPAGGVIATTDGETPGVRVEVTELKRASGGTVSLKFVVINDSTEKFSMASHQLGDSKISDDYRSVGGIHLVDPVGKKKYFVVRDSDDHCLCSREVSDVAKGSRMNLWAKFPAPPADVQKVTLEFPHFTPMDDVPIQ